LETYKNEPELLPTKKTKPKEKAENLKTCLLKTKPQNAKLEKNATAKKNDFELLNSTTKPNLRFKDDFVFTLGLPNGLRYPRWGGGRRSRPTGKMLRRRKLLEIAAESPASGARFVGKNWG